MKKVIIIIAAVALIISAIVITMPDEKLSEKQISALREQYPVYGDINKVNPLIEMALVKTTLEEISKRADTFVYGEVTEEVPVQSIYSYAKFYGYKVRVFEDVKNKLAPGEEITIIANTEFKNFNPSLSKGMKVVVPVSENKERYYFDVCVYYVTEDGFVLSAFEEKEYLDKEYSGIKIEKMLDILKKYPL